MCNTTKSVYISCKREGGAISWLTAPRTDIETVDYISILDKSSDFDESYTFLHKLKSRTCPTGHVSWLLWAFITWLLWTLIYIDTHAHTKGLHLWFGLLIAHSTSALPIMHAKICSWHSPSTILLTLMPLRKWIKKVWNHQLKIMHVDF